MQSDVRLIEINPYLIAIIHITHDIHAWGNLSRLPFQHPSNALLFLKRSTFSREQMMSTCFTSPKVVCVEIRASHSLIVWQKPLCHPNLLLIRALGLSGRGWNKKQSSPQPIGSIHAIFMEKATGEVFTIYWIGWKTTGKQTHQNQFPLQKQL
jgi:hypothetical protein